MASTRASGRVGLSGGGSSTVTDLRLVFSNVLRAMARATILGDNHPAGSRHISPEDLGTTRRLKKVGHVLRVTLLDRVILTKRPHVGLTLARHLKAANRSSR